MRGQEILYCFDHDCQIVLLNPFRRALKLHSGCIIFVLQKYLNNMSNFINCI